MTAKSSMLAKMPKFFVPFALLLGKTFLSPRKYVVLQWKLSHGDETYSINYPLHSTSIVFDLGGYKGDWSANVYKKYRCTIYIFEPIKEYVAILRKRFKKYKNIHIIPYGISGKNTNIYLHMSDDATSEFGSSENSVKVALVTAKKFMDTYKIKKVDLASINIEGGEYDLLEYLVKAKLVKKFKNIQVQFHTFVPHSKTRAKNIQKSLQKTHTLLYQFPFVWENWTLR